MASLDIVVAGPDGSGTSTQVQDIIDYFNAKDLKVVDLRGGEIDALFHTDAFRKFNHHGAGCDFESYRAFKEMNLPDAFKDEFVVEAKRALEAGRIAACVQDPSFSYLDPMIGDVFVMEEPSYRAGKSVRSVQLHRSKFGVEDDQYAKAVGYSFDRECEFIRFRKHLLEAGKIVLRSRSEESACYQVRDRKRMPAAPTIGQYLRLPGHKVAFSHPPTDIIVVHAPLDWTPEEYAELKGVRMKDRVLDDHEQNVQYQLLVNERYASDWLETLYERGQQMHGGGLPAIHRIPMYDADRNEVGKEAIRGQLWRLMDGLYRP